MTPGAEVKTAPAASSTSVPDKVDSGVLLKHKRRYCRIGGCNRIVKSQGLCQRHGAKPKTCKVEGCTKQAQGNFDKMCKAHFKLLKRQTTPIPKVVKSAKPPPAMGKSVFDEILPRSISYSAVKGGVMPLIAHLKHGFETLKPPAWHRNEERAARGVIQIENPAQQLEGWERELVWMEILILTGVPGASFRHLARAWGRDKGFHMVLAQFICERHGDVERKKRQAERNAKSDSEEDGKKKPLRFKRRKVGRYGLEPNKADDVGVDVWDPSSYGDVDTNEALASEIFDFSEKEFHRVTAKYKGMSNASVASASDTASTSSQHVMAQAAMTAILGDGNGDSMQHSLPQAAVALAAMNRIPAPLPQLLRNEIAREHAGNSSSVPSAIERHQPPATAVQKTANDVVSKTYEPSQVGFQTEPQMHASVHQEFQHELNQQAQHQQLQQQQMQQQQMQQQHLREQTPAATFSGQATLLVQQGHHSQSQQHQVSQVTTFFSGLEHSQQQPTQIAYNTQIGVSAFPQPQNENRVLVQHVVQTPTPIHVNQNIQPMLNNNALVAGTYQTSDSKLHNQQVLHQNSGVVAQQGAHFNAAPHQPQQQTPQPFQAMQTTVPQGQFPSQHQFQQPDPTGIQYCAPLQGSSQEHIPTPQDQHKHHIAEQRLQEASQHQVHQQQYEQQNLCQGQQGAHQQYVDVVQQQQQSSHIGSQISHQQPANQHYGDSLEPNQQMQYQGVVSKGDLLNHNQHHSHQQAHDAAYHNPPQQQQHPSEAVPIHPQPELHSQAHFQDTGSGHQGENRQTENSPVVQAHQEQNAQFQSHHQTHAQQMLQSWTSATTAQAERAQNSDVQRHHRRQHSQPVFFHQERSSGQQRQHRRQFSQPAYLQDLALGQAFAFSQHHSSSQDVQQTYHQQHDTSSVQSIVHHDEAKATSSIQQQNHIHQESQQNEYHQESQTMNQSGYEEPHVPQHVFNQETSQSDPSNQIHHTREQSFHQPHEAFGEHMVHQPPDELGQDPLDIHHEMHVAQANLGHHHQETQRDI